MALTNEDRELAFTPACELVEMMKSKKLSPVELMGAILRRAEELNPKLNAYLTLAGEGAMEAARQAEEALGKEMDLGPLHGLPVSIKDLYYTKGIRTTFGSPLYEDFVPDKEYSMVKRLKAAGAIIVGKTNVPQFSHNWDGPVGGNKLGDACANPWNTERTSGGSSAGAAASVAAGIGPLATGSDGGGSIRVPASYCGVYGLKPSNGRVPYDPDPESGGIFELWCHGPITRNVRDAALMMSVISGPDEQDYTCIRTAPPDFVKELDGSLKKLRIAWSPDLGYGGKVDLDPEVRSATAAAVRVFEELGHEVEEAAPAIEPPFEALTVLFCAGSGIFQGSLLDEHADELAPRMRATLEIARGLDGIEVAKTYMKAHKWHRVMQDFFENYDLLITPTTSVPAFVPGVESRKFDYRWRDWGFFPFTQIFNITHNPAASVPCGFSSDGLPIGLQIVGRQEDDAMVLRASAAFEQARPWADKRPPVS